MVIERVSTRQLGDIEEDLRRAAQVMGATIAQDTSVQQKLLAGTAVFTIEHPVLYERLLAEEARFAVFLPCRIAALEYRGGVKLIAMSPVQFAQDLQNSAAAAAADLENVLAEILIDLQHEGGTEDQVDMRDTVPQQIEDRAGTGEQDSPGG